MLCEKCGKREAVFRETVLSEEGVRDRHLCQDCIGIVGADEGWRPARAPVESQSSESSTLKLRPAEGLPVLEERPALNISRIRLSLARLACRPFYPLFRRWRERRYARLKSRIHNLFEGMRRCKDRGELERLIGEPLYATSLWEIDERGGSDYLDEYYETRGCSIVIRFKGRELRSFMAHPSQTVWDIVVAERESPAPE